MMEQKYVFTSSQTAEEVDYGTVLRTGTVFQYNFTTGR